MDAVECAVSLQRSMAKRNQGLSDEQRIDVRMGINLGDVIVEGEDRHGDGVNIAARLEGLAEPGGITLSGTVFDHLKKKVDVGFEFLGEQQVKNIAEPVRVYRILLDGQPPSRASIGSRKRGSPRSIAAASVVVLLMALIGGVAGYWYTERPVIEQGQGIPVIAVLPFQDLTGDQASNAFGKGIAERS